MLFNDITQNDYCFGYFYKLIHTRILIFIDELFKIMIIASIDKWYNPSMVMMNPQFDSGWRHLDNVSV